MRVPVAPPVVVMDGRNSLTYELPVESRTDTPVTLSSLQIDTAAPPVPLTLRGDALSRGVTSAANGQSTRVFHPVAGA